MAEIQTTEPRNDWKATVRDIFDATLLHENASGNPFADRVRRMIQERHHGYFCGGKTLAEWKREQRNG